MVISCFNLHSNLSFSVYEGIFVVKYEVVASTDLWVLLTCVAVTGTGYKCKWDGTLWDNGASTFEVISRPKSFKPFNVDGCKIRKIDNEYNQCHPWWDGLGR